MKEADLQAIGRANRRIIAESALYGGSLIAESGGDDADPADLAVLELAAEMFGRPHVDAKPLAFAEQAAAEMFARDEVEVDPAAVALSEQIAREIMPPTDADDTFAAGVAQAMKKEGLL